MAIPMQFVKALDERGLFVRGARVLDIGSSSLYCAEPHEVAAFISKYQPATDHNQVRRTAERLAVGSGYDPVADGTNESLVGEMLKAAGMEYVSYDVANGEPTHALDIEHESIPPQYNSYFDLVLNFATTGNIFNQLNCFKIVHEAAKTGGHIVHHVPSIGFAEHCYFTYTGRFFFDLAAFNEYEIVDCQFTEPSGETDLFECVKEYTSHFPALRSARFGDAADGAALFDRHLRIPNIALTIIYRKLADKPFVGALECQTSVGAIPDEIKAAYGQRAERVLRGQKRSILVRGVRKLIRIVRASA